MQHSTNQARIVEWPVRSHSLVKGTWQPAWSLPKSTRRTLRPWEINSNKTEIENFRREYRASCLEETSHGSSADQYHPNSESWMWGYFTAGRTGRQVLVEQKNKCNNVETSCCLYELLCFKFWGGKNKMIPFLQWGWNKTQNGKSWKAVNAFCLHCRCCLFITKAISLITGPFLERQRSAKRGISVHTYNMIGFISSQLQSILDSIC